MMKRMMQRMMNHFRGIPQHRRLAGTFSLGTSSWEPRGSTLRRLDLLKKMGHETRLSGVARPGLGNEARISERELEPRRSCPIHCQFVDP